MESNAEELREVGKVFTFFAKPCVAGIKITNGALNVGDTIVIRGETTNIRQAVESMEIDRVPVQSATVGQSIGIKVMERVRPNDVVYVVTTKA